MSIIVRTSRQIELIATGLARGKGTPAQHERTYHALLDLVPEIRRLERLDLLVRRQLVDEEQRENRRGDA